MSSPTVDRRSGLANVVDIVIAPGSAFARLRVVPAWGWAFVVATLLGVAGFLLMEPAQLHALEKSGPAMYGAMPQIAKLPPEKQSAAIAQSIQFGRVFTQLGWITVPFFFLIGAAIAAVFMLVANAIGHGDGSFKKYFALAMLIDVVSGLGLLLTGIIATVRGADSFDQVGSVARALPSLALVAPGASSKLATFLGALSVTSLWATALTALGMIAVGHVSARVAWIVAILMLLGAAGLAALATP